MRDANEQRADEWKLIHGMMEIRQEFVKSIQRMGDDFNNTHDPIQAFINMLKEMNPKLEAALGVAIALTGGGLIPGLGMVGHAAWKDLGWHAPLALPTEGIFGQPTETPWNMLQQPHKK